MHLPFDPPCSGKGDFHAHVCKANESRSPRPVYVPQYDAGPEKYLEVLRSHDLDWGTLVQPSWLWKDNSFLLDTLRDYPNRFRGVVVLDHQNPLEFSENFTHWDKLGVRGVRLNLFSHPIPDLEGTPWKKTIDLMSHLGWFLQFYLKPEQFALLYPSILKVKCPVIIDHLGSPNIDYNSRYHPLLNLVADREQVWVKASGAYRSLHGQSFDMFQKLQSLGFENFLPGSDWPFVQFEQAPNQAWKFFDYLY